MNEVKKVYEQQVCSNDPVEELRTSCLSEKKWPAEELHSSLYRSTIMTNEYKTWFKYWMIIQLVPNLAEQTSYNSATSIKSRLR